MRQLLRLKRRTETWMRTILRRLRIFRSDAFIPDSYIKNEALKLDIYRRIAAVENEEEQE